MAASTSSQSRPVMPAPASNALRPATSMQAQPARGPLQYPEYASVPPPYASINEGVFTVPVQFEGDQLIGNIREAMRSARLAGERSQSVAYALMNDATRTEASRHLEVSNSVHKVTIPAQEKLQAMKEKLGAKLFALEEQLKGPPLPKDAMGMMVALSCAGALHAMKPEDRSETILAAIRAGDQLTATAVLRCPPYVLGFNAAEQQFYRLQWQQAAHPNETAYLATLNSISEHLDRSAELLFKYALSLSSPVLVQRAQASAQQAAAALGVAG